MLKILKSFFITINWQTVVVVILSIVSMHFCREHEFTADYPLTLVGIAIVFPLVFSINSAYKRREDALNKYAGLKAHGRAIYFASRDWIEVPNQEKMEDLKQLLFELLNSISELFKADEDNHVTEENLVYSNFRRLSIEVKGFRALGMSGSEVSRVNQFISKMLIDFEQLKHIHQYRTPKTLRAYSKIFISLLPIIYGPYFAYITVGKPLVMAMILPILFSITLVSLDNIQEHLENPFDQIGEDDIKLNFKKFYNSLDL